MMIRLIPKVFFNRMDEGLDLFVNCLGFEVLHQDSSLAVVGKDGAKAYVIEKARSTPRRIGQRSLSKRITSMRFTKRSQRNDRTCCIRTFLA